MCSNYQRRKTYREYFEEFSHTAIPLVFPDLHAAPNLEPQPEIRPTDQAPIFRLGAGGLEMVAARWWLVPFFHKGPLKEFRLATFNARSEDIASKPTFREAFARRRCLVPADGWYEWTGPKGGKTKWRYNPIGDTPICFAGLWEQATTSDAGPVLSFTIVTQPSGAPMNAHHDRAPIVLTQRDWARWLDTGAKVDDLLGPESPEAFTVTRISGPDALL